MKNVILLIFLCLITACASIHSADEAISLDNQSRFYLQAVPKELWGQTSLQKLLVSSPEGKHELLLQTELHANNMTMVGLSSAGLVLFKLNWSNEKGLQANTNVLAQGLNAKVMLAYFQLSNWPLTSIQTGLVDLRAEISATDKHTRHFYRDAELIFSVSHKQDRSLMTHYIDHYQIEIKTLQQTKLEELHPN